MMGHRLKIAGWVTAGALAGVLTTVSVQTVARGALAPGGVLALWSADRSSAFEALMAGAGLDWRLVETPAAAGRPEPLHALYFIR